MRREGRALIGYDFGNARIGALRSRLLDATTLRAARTASSVDAVLELLAGLDDWRVPIAEASATGAFRRPVQVLQAAIERHRSRRLGGLVRSYGPPIRELVEALVLHLDEERALEVLRRRRAGQLEVTILGQVSPGALLDARAMRLVAAAPGEGGPFLVLCRLGILGGRAARALARAAEAGTAPEALEARLDEAWWRARWRRAEGSGEDAAAVRDLMRGEVAERRRVREALQAGATADAAWRERQLLGERLARLERRGHHDPLGIATVAGYVAAVEAQALRLRSILAGLPGQTGRQPGRDGRRAA